MESGEILFKKAAKGDVDAFSSFIKDYERLIYNASYRMFPNTHDAEDIAQEVMIKVYRNISSCKSAASFKSWLFRIIHNTCVDEIRKRSARRTISLDKELSESGDAIENKILIDTQTPESEYMKKAETQIIQEAIDKLPPDYRLAIILRDINGLSYEDIGKITGLNPGTVKSRISRGRNSLRGLLLQIEEQNST